MKTDNIEADRAALADRLAEVQSAPDAHRLILEAQEAIDARAREIADLQAQIARLDAQVGARRKAAKEAQDERQAADFRAKQARLAELEQQRLLWIERAEEAARHTANAMSEAFRTNRELARLAHEIAGFRGTPTPAAETEFARRLGGRLASVLATIDGHPHRLGPLEFAGTGLFKAADSWREKERNLMERHLAPLIGEE